MADKKTHHSKPSNDTTDNMAHNEETSDVLANEAEAAAADATALTENDDEKLNKLTADLDEMRDKHLRLVAEFDNFRRRVAREKMELSQTAGKEVIMSLLGVLDDMDRAAKQLEGASDITVIKEGISLVFNKLKNSLQQKGLKVMDAQEKEFDPELHEAITEIPAPNPALRGKVLDVVEQGYYLNDKLIRHAKVVVGK